ncbi:MAG: DUF2461 domain-containing protein [Bacteroidetes bacterium]|nr:DUF2461 domain-containing protein [Bacteroidota bacterium]MBU1422755.1 DUF2461 domain-containing protein [Bacteroidota bacterium]MBU2472223.1 DUF2461 domain-containing protein [Bacteroidota bacterium]MBU2635531.1 DUF2461 domain-containing protein [Bacteroidota bacterium]
MKNPLDDIQIFPPFEGFPKEGLGFLRKLKTNNNREWFAKHKHEYEEFVKLPMQSLVAVLRPLMHTFASDFVIDPRRSLFRIYRDARFSKNKLPYKTHVAAIFQPTHNWKDSAGLYIHIEPGEAYLGGGMYMPSSEDLKKIRNAIANYPERFLSIIESKDFKKYFGALEGEKLQRVPQGFSPEHEMAVWLKMKQFFISYTMTEEECYKKSFVKKVVDVFEKMMPLVLFLNEAIYMK